MKKVWRVQRPNNQAHIPPSNFRLPSNISSQVFNLPPLSSDISISGTALHCAAPRHRCVVSGRCALSSPRRPHTPGARSLFAPTGDGSLLSRGVSDAWINTMEPKVIKVENVEKDTSNYIETPRTRSKVSKDRCKTPDSPEGARQAAAPLSPTQSSPPPRPATNGAPSPPHPGSAGSVTPPLPTVGIDGVQQPYTSLLYAAGPARPLVKVRRFLGTLVQFGNDIATDVGDRVRSLVLNLVSSNLSIEEFHHSLQDVTNFPLRPFVLPFLKAHLPLLQREVHTLAKNNKQSTLQYVRTHEHIIFDPAHSPQEPSEIFLPNEVPLMAGMKRRACDSLYENGLSHPHLETPDFIPLKRPMTGGQNPFLLSQGNLLLTGPPAPHFLDCPPAAPQDPSSGRGDEEWRNIHVMLNCILSMVEKTKRALAILQQRNGQDLTGDWFRRQDVSADLKKAANEIMVQALRQAEDRVAEVRRKAEDAVNEVKRQAVIELQKAVAAAETKANELVAAEKAKVEKLLADARKHNEENVANNSESAENSLSPTGSTQPSPSQQNSCWNCGRKAHETCSGCSLAKYCGPFCQHKDWENHHQICSKEKTRPLRTSTPSTTSATPGGLINANDPIKFKK